MKLDQEKESSNASTWASWELTRWSTSPARRSDVAFALAPCEYFCYKNFEDAYGGRPVMVNPVHCVNYKPKKLIPESGGIHAERCDRRSFKSTSEKNVAEV